MTPPEMHKAALENESRYLLPNRFTRGDDPKKDELYDVASWLVQYRYAEWLPLSSTFYPGIRLTGKTFEHT